MVPKFALNIKLLTKMDNVQYIRWGGAKYRLFHFSSQSNFVNTYHSLSILYATNFLLENLFIYVFHKLIFPSGSVFTGWIRGFISACKMDVVNS